MCACAKAGVPATAVTNAPRLNGELMLGALGFLDVFNTKPNGGVVYGGECARAKPHPDPYVDAMRASNLVDNAEAASLVAGSPTPSAAEKAARGIALEDSPSGIRAAAAAGLYVVGLTTGHPPETLLAAGASTTVADYHELCKRMGLAVSNHG